MRAFESRWLVSGRRPPIDGGAVVVSGDEIVAVGEASALRSSHPDADWTDLGDAILAAGPVNAHVHFELSWAGDEDLPRGDFVEWLRAFVAMRDRLEDPEIAWAAAESALDEAVARGTAAVGDVHNGAWMPALIADTPLHAICFYEIFGFPADLAERLLAEAAGCLDAIANDADVAAADERLRLAPTPHAAYSTSAPLIKALAGRAEAAHSPIAIHVAESEAESRLLEHGDGPLRAFLESRDAWDPSWEPPGTTPIETLDRMGALGPRTLAVHAVHVSSEDIGRLQTRRATVVTCPRSNRALGVGDCPVPKLLTAGVPVALGTDSLASAPDLDPFAECAALREVHPGLAPAAAWRIATAGGARALGLDDRVGALDAGLRHTALAVSLESPGDDPFETLTSGPTGIRRLAGTDA